MKKNSLTLVLLSLLFLLITTSARELADKDGEINIKIIKKSAAQTQNPDSFTVDLLGMEECQIEEEECVKRRALAEAHLDYIYTQNHKP